MFKKLILLISVLTVENSNLFAADGDDVVINVQIGRTHYHCHADPLVKETHEMSENKGISKDKIKEIISDSSWLSRLAHLDGKIYFPTEEDTAQRSSKGKKLAKHSLRVDYEGTYSNGSKFRLQENGKESEAETFASVRIVPGIEWLWPSQLAEALYVSVINGKKIVVQ